MKFITLPGLPGKVYTPCAGAGADKKHPCADCHSCQRCSDERCALCRAAGYRAPACDCPAGAGPGGEDG